MAKAFNIYNETQVRSFELELISINADDLARLDDFNQRFNNAGRHLYKEFVSSYKVDVNLLKQSYQSDYNINARHYNSLNVHIKGQMSSAIECAKNHLSDTEFNIKKTQLKINIITKNATKSKTGCLTSKQKTNIYYANLRLHRLKDKKRVLEKQLKDNDPQLCFGSRKLFNQQFKSNVDHSEWLKQWVNARNSVFISVGSKDEHCGNINSQLRLIDDDTKDPNMIKDVNLFSLKLNLKDNSVLLKLKAHYGYDYIKQALANNQAMTYRFKRDWNTNTYRIWVSFDVIKFNIPKISHQQLGRIGVDINDGFLAIANIDHNGNKIDAFNISLNLYGKTSSQTKDIIGVATKTLVLYAIANRKPIVLEDLDFTQKRLELSHQVGKAKYKRILSSFAYSKIKENIKSRAYDTGIEIIMINPANTSKIGEVKYQERFGMTVHQSAAMVIARRGMNLVERKVFYKGVCKPVDLPVRNNRKQTNTYWKTAVESKRAHVAQRLERRRTPKIDDMQFGCMLEIPDMKSSGIDVNNVDMAYVETSDVCTCDGTPSGLTPLGLPIQIRSNDQIC